MRFSLKNACLPLLWLCFINTAMSSTIYLGTNTKNSQSRGIYRGELDVETGKLSVPVLVGETGSPSFLALSRDNRFLYACGEGDEPQITAWAVEDGGLRFLNGLPSRGASPCHVSLSHDGDHVLAANYGGGSIIAFARADDGSLEKQTDFVVFEGSGPDEKRQKAPHAHGIYSEPRNGKVLVCDLGTDQVRMFDLINGRFHEAGAGRVPGGAGPRHLAFHPEHATVYVNNEMHLSTTTFLLSGGRLEAAQTIDSIEAGTSREGNTSAEIHVHPGGRWLYVSNRGATTNHIAVHEILADGTLAEPKIYPAGVKVPRGFAIDPSGRWLIVGGQEDSRVVSLAIDPATGALSAPVATLEVGRPVCVIFEN